MHILLPAGCEIYDGAPVFSALGADGAITVVFCGLRHGQFGTHAFRQRADGQTEWLTLPDTTEKRSGVTVEASGMYTTWPDRNNRGVVRVAVPGYVPPVSDGVSVPAPQPQPQPQPPAECVDEEARQYTTAVKRELFGKIAELEARIGTGTGGGLTRQQVEAIAWEKGGDRAYAELGDPQSGIYNRVAALMPAASAPVAEAFVRAWIRDELRSLLADALNAVEIDDE